MDSVCMRCFSCTCSGWNGEGCVCLWVAASATEGTQKLPWMLTSTAYPLMASKSLISTLWAITMATTFTQFPCCSFYISLLTWAYCHRSSDFSTPELAWQNPPAPAIILNWGSLLFGTPFSFGIYTLQTTPMRHVKPLWTKLNSLGIFMAY